MSTLLQAHWILPAPGQAFEGGGILLEGGRVAAWAETPGAVRELASRAGVEHVDLGPVALSPGLVNAHAHLELSGLAGRLGAGGGFIPWVGGVLRERAGLSGEDYRDAVRTGAEALLASGTTAVGDVDSSGAAESEHAVGPLRARENREVLDGGDTARTPDQLRRLDAEAPEGALLGLSPHAPHTVGPELLAACVQRSGARRLPFSVHWAETPEECSWLAGEGGPFADLLGAAPGCSGLDLLQRAGALGPRTSLVHANHPEPGELELVARSGAVLVHCPGTHDYFGRDRWPVEAWIASGVTVALGTDSLASNETLDMRREMALLRRTHRDLAPELVLDWATRGGARALDLAREIGELGIGMRADLVAFELPGPEALAAPVDWVTGAELVVGGVWVEGCAI